MVRLRAVAERVFSEPLRELNNAPGPFTNVEVGVGPSGDIWLGGMSSDVLYIGDVRRLRDALNKVLEGARTYDSKVLVDVQTVPVGATFVLNDKVYWRLAWAPDDTRDEYRAIRARVPAQESFGADQPRCEGGGLVLLPRDTLVRVL